MGLPTLIEVRISTTVPAHSAQILQLAQVRDDARAAGVEAKRQGAQAARNQGRVHVPAIRGRGLEHQEAAAARAHQLATDGARCARGLVMFVDRRVTHVGRELALFGPMLVQELAVAVHVAAH